MPGYLRLRTAKIVPTTPIATRPRTPGSDTLVGTGILANAGSAISATTSSAKTENSFEWYVIPNFPF